MARENFNELLAFVAVAREGSFTRAAEQLNVSQSALSHTIRSLETRLDMRLLTRTTRSVSPTEAGERLLSTLAPRFQEIEAALLAITSMGDRPSGTLHISAPGQAAESILLPVLARLMPLYPELKVEISVNEGRSSKLEQSVDGDVRLGELLAKEIVAVRISPDLRMAVVGSADYFARHAMPLTPHQLVDHNCINRRSGATDGFPTWEFSRDGYPVHIRVEGQTVLHSVSQTRRAALAGLGVAFLLEDVVQDDVASGRLVRVLEEWCPPFAGYFLHYQRRRERSPAFSLLLDALRDPSERAGPE